MLCEQTRTYVCVNEKVETERNCLLDGRKKYLHLNLSPEIIYLL